MLKDSEAKKNAYVITQVDIDEALAETIEQRVTPFAHMTYPEQL
jgi:hypothetical protein